MASNINSTSIDATFPVAGQDNNSQGFRDNFNTIKGNFASAKSEIEALQTNTAKLNANNNFAGNEVSGALFIGNFFKHYNAQTITTSQNISLTLGNFQTAAIGADVTLTLSDWSSQSNALESVVIQLVKSGGNRTVTWATDGGTIKKDSNFPNPFVLDSTTDPHVVEFYSFNNGVTVFARYLGQFV